MNWLRSHKFEADLIAFLLMLLPGIGLYFLIENQQSWESWALLSLIIIGNLSVLLI
jgi:hypothetical protein